MHIVKRRITIFANEKQKIMENNYHPLEQMTDEIREKGLVVIDNVTRMPVYGEPYLSPYLIVCLNHQGNVRAEYNMQKVTFYPHDIAMILPEHTLTALDSSDDYKATLLVISNEFLEWLRKQVTTFTYFQYHNISSAHLTDNQFESMHSYFRMLDAISRITHPARMEMLAAQIAVGTRMCDLYIMENEKRAARRLSDKQLLLTRFYDAIVEHFRESREVQFYAKLLCLSPKYFGTIIRQETGQLASDWIARYVVIQAKTLLRQRPDLSIQQIANMLGFDQSAAFTRYFKTETGMTPREYRDSR